MISISPKFEGAATAVVFVTATIGIQQLPADREPFAHFKSLATTTSAVLSILNFFRVLWRERLAKQQESKIASQLATKQEPIHVYLHHGNKSPASGGVELALDGKAHYPDRHGHASFHRKHFGKVVQVFTRGHGTMRLMGSFELNDSLTNPIRVNIDEMGAA